MNNLNDEEIQGATPTFLLLYFCLFERKREQICRVRNRSNEKVLHVKAFHSGVYINFLHDSWSDENKSLLKVVPQAELERWSPEETLIMEKNGVSKKYRNFKSLYEIGLDDIDFFLEMLSSIFKYEKIEMIFEFNYGPKFTRDAYVEGSTYYMPYNIIQMLKLRQDPQYFVHRLRGPQVLELAKISKQIKIKDDYFPDSAVNYIVRKWVVRVYPHTWHIGELKVVRPYHWNLNYEDLFYDLPLMQGAPKRPNSSRYYKADRHYEDGWDFRSQDGRVATLLIEYTVLKKTISITFWDSDYPNLQQ